MIMTKSGSSLSFFCLTGAFSLIVIVTSLPALQFSVLSLSSDLQTHWLDDQAVFHHFFPFSERNQRYLIS